MNIVRKGLLFVLGILITSITFSQQAQNNWQLQIARELKIFTDKVKVLDVNTQKPILPGDGSYRIKNDGQQAEFSLKNKLINGTASIFKDNHHDKTEYVIVNSFVQSFKIYTGNVLLISAYRDISKVYFKEYDADGTVDEEGWASLDKNKHFGRGITKKYYKDGALAKISNHITETYTEYYSNGNKKSIHGQGIYETYHENGNLYNKQYTKNKIHYDEYYDWGKLITRSYKNAEQSEVMEYYENGIFQRKGIAKNINGEKRLLIYNKAGKLIGNEPYSVSGIKTTDN